MQSFLDRYFKLSENQTTIRTELMAGLTTFLTMCYIVVVNPHTLSQAGMDFGAVFVATCISAAIGCLIMGALANYPIALAPGMGLNAYFTFSVVKGMGVPWQVALAAVFVSGIIFILFSFLKVREMLVNALPMSLKMAIAAGIGLFLALIALKGSGVVVGNEATLVHMGEFRLPVEGQPGVYTPNWPMLLALLGFFIIVVLDYFRVRGAIIIGILGVTLLAVPLGLTRFERVVSAIPSMAPTFMQMDFNHLFSGSLIALGKGWPGFSVFNIGLCRLRFAARCCYPGCRTRARGCLLFHRRRRVPSRERPGFVRFAATTLPPLGSRCRSCCG